MKSRSAPYGRAGSKVRLADWIVWVASFVPHRKWGELFAGTCAVTLNKPRVNWEFLNDKDEMIYNFLSVLRDRRQKAELLRRLRYTSWDRADYGYCTSVIKGRTARPDDPVELARIFLVNNCQSFDRSGRTFSVSDVKSGIGKWKRIAEYIDYMADRIQDCTILNLDYADALALPQINDPSALIYIDAPYVDVEKTFYTVNKRDGFDHVALRTRLDECRASVLLSYEDHPEIRTLYPPAEGWIIKERSVTRSLGNNGKRATELLIVRKSEWAARQEGTMPSRSGLRDMYDLEGKPV